LLGLTVAVPRSSRYFFLSGIKQQVTAFFPVLHRIDKARFIVDGKDRKFVINDRLEYAETSITALDGMFSHQLDARLHPLQLSVFPHQATLSLK